MEYVDIKFLSQESHKVYQGGDLLSYQTVGSSGFDIRAVGLLLPDGGRVNLQENNFILKAGQRACIQTGFAVSMPLGYEMQIRPRSGLAFKNGITIVNSPGTIDSDYRGEIGAILLNTSDIDFEIKLGDRIAQAVLSKVYQVKMNFTDEIDSTERGDGRFGSTGVK
jgi:dUTP pyrophosphatase